MNDENEDRDLQPDDDADLPEAVFPTKAAPIKSDAELWAEFVRGMKKFLRKFVIVACVCLPLLLLGYAVHRVATTDIYEAACKGETLLVRIRLLLGADVNATKHGSSPLIGAAEHGQQETVKLLLENGADPNLVPPNDPLKATPLHQICKDFYDSGSESVKCNIALMLIEYGANVNGTNDFLQTPLHIAAQNGLPHLAKLLIDNGADVNALWELPYTPLDIAIQNVRPERREPILTMLKENGAMTFAELSKEPATPNIKDLYFLSLKSLETFDIAGRLRRAFPELLRMPDPVNKMTFLHYCARYGIPGNSIHVSGIDIKDLNINALDENGKTPLDYAEEKGNKEIIEILKKAGAKTAEELKEAAAPPPDADGAQ